MASQGGSMNARTLIGRPVERAEDLRFLRGAGEGGMVAVAATAANAIAAALVPLGGELRDLPLSPAQLWGLVNGGGALTRAPNSSS
jgi:CO/xanthine dehydrogenase Mo-binding subunit